MSDRVVGRRKGYLVEPDFDAPSVEEITEALAAAMDYIDKTPCDPDVYDDQAQAWARLQDAKPRRLLKRLRGGP